LGLFCVCFVDCFCRKLNSNPSLLLLSIKLLLTLGSNRTDDETVSSLYLASPNKANFFTFSAAFCSQLPPPKPAPWFSLSLP
jgi:hypothetical protein